MQTNPSAPNQPVFEEDDFLSKLQEQFMGVPEPPPPPPPPPMPPPLPPEMPPQAVPPPAPYPENIAPYPGAAPEPMPYQQPPYPGSVPQPPMQQWEPQPPQMPIQQEPYPLPAQQTMPAQQEIPLMPPMPQEQFPPLMPPPMPQEQYYPPYQEPMPPQQQMLAPQMPVDALYPASPMMQPVPELPLEPRPDLDDKLQKAMENPRRKKTMKLVTDIIFYIVIIAILLGSILFVVARGADIPVMGYRIFNVLTTSMQFNSSTPEENKLGNPDGTAVEGSVPEGSIPKGAIVVVKVVEDKSTLKRGDVITFYPGGRKGDTENYLTHRIYEVIPNYKDSGQIGFRTKGDSNKQVDLTVTLDVDVVGVVTRTIPMMGTIMNYVQNNFIIIVILIILFAVLAVLLRSLFDVKKKKETAAQLQPAPPPAQPR